MLKEDACTSGEKGGAGEGSGADATGQNDDLFYLLAHPPQPGARGVLAAYERAGRAAAVFASNRAFEGFILACIVLVGVATGIQVGPRICTLEETVAQTDLECGP